MALSPLEGSWLQYCNRTMEVASWAVNRAWRMHHWSGRRVLAASGVGAGSAAADGWAQLQLHHLPTEGSAAPAMSTHRKQCRHVNERAYVWSNVCDACWRNRLVTSLCSRRLTLYAAVSAREQMSRGMESVHGSSVVESERSVGDA